MSETALLVIDVQVAMFEEPEGPCADAERLVGNVSRLVGGAREAGTDVIFIQHTEDGGPFEPGNRQHEVHPDITPLEGEPVIRKRTPDSFHETELQGILDARGVEKLVICGLQTEVCVNATTRRAGELGYEVTLASDAHGTFDGGDVSAADIVRQHNGLLREVAAVESTQGITFEGGKV